MESGDLRVFQMVAREGTITKAALQLGYVNRMSRPEFSNWKLSWVPHCFCVIIGA